MRAAACLASRTVGGSLCIAGGPFLRPVRACPPFVLISAAGEAQGRRVLQGLIDGACLANRSLPLLLLLSDILTCSACQQD